MMALAKPKSGTSRDGGVTLDLASLHQALGRLQGMPCPGGLYELADWRGVLMDAEHLVQDGWAKQALALGWDMRELFGVGDSFDGLASWLCDRRVAILSTDGAICLGYDGSRSFYRRVDPGSLTLIWNWPLAVGAHRG